MLPFRRMRNCTAFTSWFPFSTDGGMMPNQLFLTERYTCRRQLLKSTPSGSVSNSNPAETFARGRDYRSVAGDLLFGGSHFWGEKKHGHLNTEQQQRARGPWKQSFHLMVR